MYLYTLPGAPFTPPSAPGRLLPSRLALINQLIKGVKWANQLVSCISTNEDWRKERTRAPPNFWEGGTGGPACETSLNGLKAGMGRGARAPPIVWEGGGRGAQVTRPMSDISEFITCQRGSAEGGDTCPSQLLRGGGGGHRWPCLCQTSLNGFKSMAK